MFGSVKEGYAIRGEGDLDILIVPRSGISHPALWRILEDEVTATLRMGLAPHLIIYRKKGMRSLLNDVRRSGRRLL